jgi:hypothetical protein
VNAEHVFIDGLIHNCESVHLNSFTYDFHIRHFVTYTLNATVPYPSFNLHHTLTAFKRVYSTPPTHARDLVVRKRCTMALSSTVQDNAHFFTYFAQHAKRYETIGNVAHRRGDLAVITIPLADPAGGKENSYLFLAFLPSHDVAAGDKVGADADDTDEDDCSDDEDGDLLDGEPVAGGADGGLVLECFVMRASNAEPSPRTKRVEEAVIAVQRGDMKQVCVCVCVCVYMRMCVYVCGQFTMSACPHQAIIAAEAVLRRAMDQALIHYQRDQIWRQIVEGWSLPRDLPGTPSRASHSGISPSALAALSPRQSENRDSNTRRDSRHQAPSTPKTPPSRTRTMASGRPDGSVPGTTTPGGGTRTGLLELRDFGEAEYAVFRSLTVRRPLEEVDTSLADLTSVGVSGVGKLTLELQIIMLYCSLSTLSLALLFPGKIFTAHTLSNPLVPFCIAMLKHASGTLRRDDGLASLRASGASIRLAGASAQVVRKTYFCLLVEF